MLKVGELAALADLTVRTLHHYDSIGLLRPSARSDAGYRLYDRNDVARLQQIQALRAFGMSLADIGLALDNPDHSPLTTIDRQLAELDARISADSRLRDQLRIVRGQLAGGAAPDLSTWLTTLEMTMEHLKTYEKYFTPEELERLPMYRDDAVRSQWRALVEQAQGLIESQVPPDSDAAKAFALRWLQAFERDTGGDAALAAKLNVMAERERDAAGVPAPVMGYVMRAIGKLKEDTWARYLRPEVIARMGHHYATRGAEWTNLIQAVHAQRKSDPEATAPQSRELARQWLELFHDMVGTDPDDVAAFRRATAQEPLLRMGPGIKDDMLAWLRKGMAQAR